MKQVSLFLITILFPLLSNAQLNDPDVTIRIPNRLTVGDDFFTPNYQGLTNYMDQLKTDEPELYQVMLPRYNAFKNKRKKALTTLIAGTISGTTMIVGGATFFAKEETEVIRSSPLTFFNNQETVTTIKTKEPNVAVMGIGFGIVGITALISAIIWPGENELYDFISHHNKHSGDKRMKWQFGLSNSFNQPLGMSIAMKF